MNQNNTLKAAKYLASYGYDCVIKDNTIMIGVTELKVSLLGLLKIKDKFSNVSIPVRKLKKTEEIRDDKNILTISKAIMLSNEEEYEKHTKKSNEEYIKQVISNRNGR